MSKICRGGTERARYWQRHLDRWERSGLSQAAFCRRHGLKPVTFSWWKRKLGTAVASSQERGRGVTRTFSRKLSSSYTRTSLRKPADSGPRRTNASDANFVEVEMTSPGIAAYEVVLSCGLVIRLPADFDPDKVFQLVAAVSAAC